MNSSSLKTPLTDLPLVIDTKKRRLRIYKQTLALLLADRLPLLPDNKQMPLLRILLPVPCLNPPAFFLSEISTVQNQIPYEYYFKPHVLDFQPNLRLSLQTLFSNFLQCPHTILFVVIKNDFLHTILQCYFATKFNYIYRSVIKPFDMVNLQPQPFIPEI